MNDYNVQEEPECQSDLQNLFRTLKLPQSPITNLHLIQLYGLKYTTVKL